MSSEDKSSRKADLGSHLDRIWRELKDLTRQVESETRRGGQIAKLHFEVRGLRQELTDLHAQLGQLISDAQRERGRRPALARLAGYDELVARIDATVEKIEAKRQQIAALGGDIGEKASAA